LYSAIKSKDTEALKRYKGAIIIQNAKSASKVLYFTGQLYGTVGHLLRATTASHMFGQWLKLIFLESENPDLAPLSRFCDSGTT